jgi:hypothetical protein
MNAHVLLLPVFSYAERRSEVPHYSKLRSRKINSLLLFIWLAFILQLRDPGLKKIAARCSNTLKTLHLAECFNVTGEALALVLQVSL